MDAAGPDSRTARELLRPHYIALDPELPLGDAEGLMTAARARSLPVVEGGRLRGLLTHRGLHERYAESLRGVWDAPAALRRERLEEARAEPVREAMAPPGDTATPATSLRELSRLLRRLETGFVAVLDAVREGARLLGIVTESDLLRAARDRSFRRHREGGDGDPRGGAPQDGART